jgi:hypothetical protein
MRIIEVTLYKGQTSVHVNTILVRFQHLRSFPKAHKILNRCVAATNLLGTDCGRPYPTKSKCRSSRAEIANVVHRMPRCANYRRNKSFFQAGSI